MTTGGVGRGWRDYNEKQRRKGEVQSGVDPPHSIKDKNAAEKKIAR
jgi:hypothetical protein